uniref:Reverse transcriptase domain-containing protein n=1 Tax=Periophthalmus magnuspinnatus TaxID=409849 RepID=A0A3B3ZWF5_9GOBI
MATDSDLGICGTVLDWFSSYLSDGFFLVSINNVMSEVSSLSCIQQGSVLGPLLFLMHIFPIGQIVNNFKDLDRIKINKKLLQCLSCIKNWLAEKNFLQLNDGKNETLILAEKCEFLLHVSCLSGIYHWLGMCFHGSL